MIVLLLVDHRGLLTAIVLISILMSVRTIVSLVSGPVSSILRSAIVLDPWTWNVILLVSLFSEGVTLFLVVRLRILIVTFAAVSRGAISMVVVLLVPVPLPSFLVPFSLPFSFLLLRMQILVDRLYKWSYLGVLIKRFLIECLLSIWARNKCTSLVILGLHRQLLKYELLFLLELLGVRDALFLRWSFIIWREWDFQFFGLLLDLCFQRRKSDSLQVFLLFHELQILWIVFERLQGVLDLIIVSASLNLVLIFDRLS